MLFICTKAMLLLIQMQVHERRTVCTNYYQHVMKLFMLCHTCACIYLHYYIKENNMLTHCLHAETRGHTSWLHNQRPKCSTHKSFFETTHCYQTKPILKETNITSEKIAHKFVRFAANILTLSMTIR